jgi:hypothetical protein
MPPRLVRSDSGIALVLAMCVALVASVIGASLMLLAQTETYASMNYRSMTQARYGAEAGLHKAINYLLNTYPQPGGGSDPLAAYVATGSPVTYGGSPVVLSAMSGIAANYPISGTSTAFTTAGQGTLSLNGVTVNYTSYAKLLSMQTLTAYGTGAQSVVQTWLITADGTTSGTRGADVEVSAVLERQVVPSSGYAIFATAATCGALTFGGSASTDSYDSSNITYSGGQPVVTQTPTAGGNVGTNGNMTATGNIRIWGTLSSPRTGVGTCTSGGVDAYTDASGSPAIEGNGGVPLQLPQAVVYPTPALPNPLPSTASASLNHNGSCAQLIGIGALASQCAAGGTNPNTGGPELTLTPGGAAVSLGNVTLTNDITLVLKPGTYNLNSLSTTGNVQLLMDPTVTTANPVIFNVAGQSLATGSTPAVNFQNGAAISVATFNPALLQIRYAGTNPIILTGGSTSAAMVYAPNSPIQVTRGGDFYGAIIGSTTTNTGGTFVHYDKHLSTDFMTVGNYMLSSFSWKKQ